MTHEVPEGHILLMTHEVPEVIMRSLDLDMKLFIENLK